MPKVRSIHRVPTRPPDSVWPHLPDSIPEPTGALKEALVALRELGERPDRRRQSYLWDKARQDLLIVTQAQWPAFVWPMRRAGWCGKCLHYIGKGIAGHYDHCKSKPMERIMEVLRPVR